MAALKDKSKVILPIILMVVLAVSMWPGVSGPVAQALGLWNGENFSAGYALAFCAGIYFPKGMRWTLTLGTLVVVNICTNLYYGVSPLHPYLFAKILAFSLLIWLGTKFAPKTSWIKQVGGGLLGAIIFYIVTNTASWMWDPAYQKTLLGWFQALTTGTPGFPPTIQFLLNSLISGGLFTGLFAGAMKLSGADETSDQEAEEAPQAEEAEAEGALPAPDKSEA